MASDTHLDRRTFLAGGIAAGAALLSPAFLREALASAVAGENPYGPLQPPNADGLMLPPGFTSRQITRGGTPVGGYVWHFAPDGQATYRTLDGGHILVQNSEAPSALGGGSSAIRFGRDGSITGARRILAGSNLNCAGGPTPWGTWLSGEEHPGGMIWEADPAGVLPAVPRPALGSFSHEAAAVDPVEGHVYLTEDQGDGLFYRFDPATPGDLTTGVLEAAIVGENGKVTWARVPDPNLVTQGRETRRQVPGATPFRGGEGLWHHEGVMYFTTKGDHRVWSYDCAKAKLQVVYDRESSAGGALRGVDNVTVSPVGDLYVCEDGDNMEICIITRDGIVAPFLRMTGPEHAGSEMTGVVFDPTATRMYFSSQRAHPYGGLNSTASPGATYEVTGPFRLPSRGVRESWVFGPPAGERPPVAPAAAPIALRAARSPQGVRAEVALRRPGTVDVVLRSSDLRTAPWWSGGPDRPVATTVAAQRLALDAGTHTVDLALPAGPASRSLEATLVAVTTVEGQHSAVGVPLVL